MYMRLLKDHEGRKAGTFIDVGFLAYQQLLQTGVAELWDGDKMIQSPPPMRIEQPASIEPQAESPPPPAATIEKKSAPGGKAQK